MTVTFRSITNARQAAQYLTDGADYLLDEAAHDVFYRGQAAGMLGIEGRKVSVDGLAALLENRHPLTGKPITPGKGKRRAGYEITVSDPKSVSVMELVAGDTRIAGARDRALQAMMDEIERHAAARVRKGGADHDRFTGNLCYAAIPHRFSRPMKSGGLPSHPDPQGHHHVVVASATWDKVEGKWKALQLGDIKSMGEYFSAFYNQKLAEQLQDLGYSIRVTKHAFEIDGVPERVIREFSRRTQKIEEVAERIGVTRPETKAKLGATTRERKTSGLSMEELRSIWLDRMTPHERETLDRVYRESLGPKKEPVIDNRRAFDAAWKHLTERQSVVAEVDVLTQALKRGVGSVTVDGLRQEIARPEFMRTRIGLRRLMTSRDIILEEMQLTDLTKAGRGKYRRLGRDYYTVKDANLSKGQRRAVIKILDSKGKYISLQGYAGVGKTTTLKAIKAGIEAGGGKVTVLAPTVPASRGTLRADGVEGADTLQKFLANEAMQDAARGEAIFLDEASLASTKDLLNLARLAEKLDARVVLFGDPMQHKSVSRGNVLWVMQHLGGVETVRLTDIVRQSGDFRKVADLLARGRSVEAFDKLDRMEQVFPVDQLAQDYVEAIGEGKTVSLVAPSRAEGEALTQAIREELKAKGRIAYEEQELDRLIDLQTTEADRQDPATYSQPGLVAQFERNVGPYRIGQRVEATVSLVGVSPGTFRIYRPETGSLAVGDRIRLTKGGYAAAHARDVPVRRLEAGSIHRVAGFTDAGVKLDNGQVLPRGHAHWAYAYTQTSPGSQSATADVSMLSITAASGQAANATSLYVGLTRGKEMRIYAQEKQLARKLIEEAEFKPAALSMFPPINRPSRLQKFLARLRAAGVMFQSKETMHGPRPETQGVRRTHEAAPAA
jgi:conjugative relaxase-like TrwC/TraI family protein